MSEERFNRIESMLTDLIKIVGSTNAVVFEMKDDVAALKDDVAVLKDDVAVLKVDVQAVKKEQELFMQELFAQSERIDNNHNEVMKRLDDLETKVDYSLKALQRHDIEIFKIKEKLAV